MREEQQMEKKTEAKQIHLDQVLPGQIEAKSFGLSKNSVVLLEQIRTLDKKRLKEKMGRLDGGVMHRVDNAISVSLGLTHSDTEEV